MRLARNPGEAVLFARDVNGSWNRLLVLDPATRPIVDLMIAHTEDWTSPDGIAERRDTFAELLNHPDAVIRELALRELDALPYKVLRERIYPVSADDLLRGIKNVNSLPSAPIRILLLGINGEDRARDAIADQLDHMAKTGSVTNLGAWTTAMMEVSGADGIAALGRLSPGPDSRWTEAHRIELVRALALISSEGDPGLRNAVDGAIRTLVLHDPEAALLIVQAFGANGDYSQIGFIRELVASRAFADRAGLMAATAYITRAGLGASARFAVTRPGLVANVP